MPADPDDVTFADPNSFAALRARLHNQNDTIQKQAGTLIDHGGRLTTLERHVDALTTRTATREQLDAAVLALGAKLTASVDLMTLQIKAIVDDLAPIRKGIYWVVTLVLGAVILAGLSFLLRRPGL